MKPYQLLNRIVKQKKIRDSSFEMSPQVRKIILNNGYFRDFAKNINNVEEINVAYDGLSKINRIEGIVNQYIGFCPRCGGKMHWRSGHEFDNEQRCVICSYIKR